MKTISSIIITMTALLLSAAVQPLHAKGNNFQADSATYRVYLGIVPVNMLKKNPSLVDQDKQLHGGIDQQPATMQHVMVAIYRKDDNARVLDATVIAKVSPRKLFGGRNSEKPLEKMTTSGAVAYANFFDMPKKGEYKIEVNIFQAHKAGSEKVRFNYLKN